MGRKRDDNEKIKTTRNMEEKNEMKQYHLNFRGYWRDVNKGGIPTVAGVYLVYRCVYNTSQDTVRLNEIIYIGQSENVHDRIANHEKASQFSAKLHKGEELCYACAEVSIIDLSVVENALIFAQKPVLNDELKDSFKYGKVAIKADGKCACLTYTDYSIS